MRIVQFLWSMDLKDGGVVRALLDLCTALAAAGHDVTMLCCRDVDVPDSWKSAAPTPGLPHAVKIDPPGRLRRLPPAALSRAAAAISDADVVHIHGMWMPSNDQIASLAAKLGKPYIWSTHGMLDDWCMEQGFLKKRLYLAASERRLLENAAAVHCTAKAELDQSSKWFPRGRGVVAPLFFDLEPFKTLPGPALACNRFGLPLPDPRREGVLLFLSRLHPKKGVDVLLSAAAELKASGLGTRVVIAGTGDKAYTESLHQFVRAQGLRDQVIFTGFVSGELKTSLYQAADVFVLPSSQENFGFVVVEALMCRTPVITTRGVAIWPELSGSGAARLVEPSGPMFAAAIKELLADRELLAEMGRRGREFVGRFLDPARVLADLESMYQQASAAAVPAGRIT